MRIQTLAALSIIGMVAASQTVFNPAEKTVLRREVLKNSFGGMETVEYHEEGSAKTVYLPQKDFVRDYER